jgi:hypothetical protein
VTDQLVRARHPIRILADEHTSEPPGISMCTRGSEVRPPRHPRPPTYPHSTSSIPQNTHLSDLAVLAWRATRMSDPTSSVLLTNIWGDLNGGSRWSIYGHIVQIRSENGMA